MERLTAVLVYEWKPFTLDGVHLTFGQHVQARIESRRCSCWGPAVYKWEGSVLEGPHAGKTGILIGETSDLRQRIKQYVSGTQERGNKLWRETFLVRGDIRLYTLDLDSFELQASDRSISIAPASALASANMRLVLEQLLVMRAVASADESTWVVNARQ